MKPEQKMWARLRGAMGYSWHAQRHEDSISRGIPDVSYGAKQREGWIELKVLPAWPRMGKLLQKIVKIPKFTPQQKSWLVARGQFSNNCWFLLKVKDEWILFHWRNVIKIGKLTEREMKSIASMRWDDKEMNRGKFFRDMLLQILTHPPIFIEIKPHLHSEGGVL